MRVLIVALCLLLGQSGFCDDDLCAIRRQAIIKAANQKFLYLAEPFYLNTENSSTAIYETDIKTTGVGLSLLGSLAGYGDVYSQKKQILLRFLPRHESCEAVQLSFNVIINPGGINQRIVPQSLGKKDKTKVQDIIDQLTAKGDEAIAPKPETLPIAEEKQESAE
jgi:hypothetical protein